MEITIRSGKGKANESHTSPICTGVEGGVRGKVWSMSYQSKCISNQSFDLNDASAEHKPELLKRHRKGEGTKA